MGLSEGRKSFRIDLAVLIQYRSVTASHPAAQPARQVAVAITLYAIASSLKIGSKCVSLDFYTNSTSQVQKGSDIG